MPHPTGRTIPLSLSRRAVGDLMACAQRVPLVTMQRRMRLSGLVAARAAAVPRVGWCAIFTKAFAAVAARRPELRRCYLPLPWPRLYEHPISVAGVAIERPYQGEDAVFFGHVRHPDQLELTALDLKLRQLKTDPLEEIGSYRRALRVARLPQPLRRLAWRVGLDLYGPWHARLFGTFGVSVTAGEGAATCGLLSPTTTTLVYSPFEPDGSIDVRLTFDHRVLDGAPVARALAELEEELSGNVRAELAGRSLRSAA